MKIPLLIIVVFSCMSSVNAMKSPQFLPDVKNRDSSAIFINGWEYKFRQAKNGHPFAFSKIWEYGTIHSELGVRSDLLMNYDIHKDVLVIQYFVDSNPWQIVLNPRYIRSFNLNGKKFVNSHELNIKNSEYSGYFELVYEGKLKYLLKRKKIFKESDGMEGSRYEDDIQKILYLRGNLYEIKNRRSVFKLFPEHKKEIGRFIRKNQIMLRQKNGDRIPLLLKYLENFIE